MKITGAGDITLAPVRRASEADRKREYRRRAGDALRARDAERKRRHRAGKIPRFTGVDSEGIGRGKDHRAVLLGVGEKQYIAADTRAGLHWQEVFSFLYSCFEDDPEACYVGFYLTYDFNEWLRTLPRESAYMLLTEKGREKRRRRDRKGRQYFPVRCDGWEIDMLGFKRLSIRPWCGHVPRKGHPRCGCKAMPWMHICDAGPFFQMSFRAVLDPRMWVDDPAGDVCTPAQREIISAGKERRSHAELDDEMMCYNRLENVLLSQVMDRLAAGFRSVGIHLGRDEWYGPGAAANKWLDSHGAPKRHMLESLGMPEWFSELCRKSYYAGWFEIFSHGIIPGKSWNYDINSAYPYATSQLPHLCRSCRYRRGTGEYHGNGDYVLLYATVLSRGQRIGAVPYRDGSGNVLRPAAAKGWYWLHELCAAGEAGLIERMFVYEWAEFIPCSHPAPFSEVREMYNLRKSVGKNSPMGLAVKLIINSLYGKFAQSTGRAPYGNWLYATLITSMCRTQILRAIASHPGRADSVLMVATDGICFDARHPGLPVSGKLGEWEEKSYTDLCLFKPGVYWHREGKERLAKIKSRGVPKDAFRDQLEAMEVLFDFFIRSRSHPQAPAMREELRDEFGEVIAELTVESGWPKFWAMVPFRLKSCKQALNEGKWESAGTVQEEFPLLQSSDPEIKRSRPHYNPEKNRIDTMMRTLPFTEDKETTYYRIPMLENDYGYDEDGEAINKTIDLVNAVKLTDDDEWEVVWE